jgi:hypothetical protein
VNASLFRSSFDRGDFTGAAARIDALFRTNGVPEFTTKAVLELEASAQGREALTKRLILGPPWRERYLRQVGQLEEREMDNRIMLLRELAALGSPAQPLTASLVARVLLRRGKGAEAGAVWAWSAPAAAGRPTLLFDGGFELPAEYRLPPFGWELLDSYGARVDVEPAAAGRNSLHVVTATGAATPIASQWLLLRPGRYRIDLRLLQGGTATIEPTLECRGRKRRMIMTPHGLAGFVFSVPPEPDCDQQRLRLHVQAAGAGATVDLDEVTIRPFSD